MLYLYHSSQITFLQIVNAESIPSLYNYLPLVSPIRRQAVAVFMTILPKGTNFCVILIKTQNFSFTKCILKYRMRNGGNFVLWDMS